MSNVLEFLDLKDKEKKINFPLLEELIQLLKKYRIFNYKVYDNIVRFKFKCIEFKIEYVLISHDLFYAVGVDNTEHSYALWPKEFISGLEMHYLGSIECECKEYTTLTLPNINCPYPSLKAKDMVKR